MSVGIHSTQDDGTPSGASCAPASDVARALHPSGAWLRHPLATDALADIAGGLAAAVSAGVGAGGALPARGDVVRERLLVTAGYDAWIMRWAPGAVVEEHDHDGCVGVIQVVEGELVEYARDLDPASDPVRRELPAGATTAFGVDGRHRLANVGGLTVTVQVYSPPLGPT